MGGAALRGAVAGERNRSQRAFTTAFATSFLGVVSVCLRSAYASCRVSIFCRSWARRWRLQRFDTVNNQAQSLTSSRSLAMRHLWQTTPASNLLYTKVVLPSRVCGRDLTAVPSARITACEAFLDMYSTDRSLKSLLRMGTHALFDAPTMGRCGGHRHWNLV